MVLYAKAGVTINKEDVYWLLIFRMKIMHTYVIETGITQIGVQFLMSRAYTSLAHLIIKLKLLFKLN
jgi:hypothetical protein